MVDSVKTYEVNQTFQNVNGGVKGIFYFTLLKSYIITNPLWSVSNDVPQGIVVL